MDGNRRQNQTAFTHWKPIEDLLYHLYLVMNFDPNRPQKQKKKNGYFVQMSDFIGKERKDQIQCYSHHSKRIKVLRKMLRQNSSLNIQLIILTKFYKNYYLDRMQGVQKLKSEIKHHLSERIRSGSEFKKDYQRYLGLIDEKVQQLMLNIDEQFYESQEEDRGSQENQMIPDERFEQNDGVKQTQEQHRNQGDHDAQTYLNKSQIFEDFYEDDWLMLSGNSPFDLLSFDNLSKKQANRF